MKRNSQVFSFFLLMVVLQLPLTAQNGTWTWMKGSQVPYTPPVFGTQGVSAPTNNPQGGYESAEWTDLNGNFWVFGGLEGLLGTYNAVMWRYTPANNEWTWMNGPQAVNTPGIYGVQGVPAPTNCPGARSYGARTWTDNNGNLWLFSSYGYDVNGNLNSLNDMWKYDVNTNEWTWMSGPQTGGNPSNFGIQGVPSPTNLPPGSTESVATWVDAAGNLWMYGGVDLTYPGTDDVWRYDVSTNIWTWMSGQSSGLVPANYGTLGVPSPTNTPGGRYVYGHWQDQQGNFWMFGGMDYLSAQFADMWRYNPTTGIWTWMAGSNVLALQPVGNTFTAQCTAGGHPDGIYENRACWTDQCGRFWGMGGEHNYLWFFDPQTSQFTWVTGSLVPSPSPVYGTQTIPAPGNVPAPVYGGNGFVDNAGDLWLFGGYNPTIGELNQLWRYQIDPNCSPQNFQINFPIVTPSSACAGSPVTFSPQSENNYNFFWDFGDTTLSTDTSSVINATWTYNQAGTYTYTLIVTNNYSCGPGEDTLTGTITIYPEPIVNLGSDSIFCSTINGVLLDAGNPGASYLWNTGATSQTITTTTPATYFVTVTTDPAGNCSASDTIVFTPAAQITLGPDTAICSGASITLDPGIALQDYLWNTGDTTQAITVSASGVYTVQIITAACTLSTSLTLTVLPLPVVNLGNDTTLCGTVNLLLDAGNPGTTFLWSTGATSQTITANAAGSYSVLVSDSQCTNQDSIVITLQTVPLPYLGGDTTLCAGQSLLLDPGVTAQQYLWNTGDTTATLLVSTAGFYSVQVINPPCSLTASMNLSITPLPVVNLGNDTTLCPGDSVLLDAQNPGAGFSWSTGSTQQSFFASTAGTYIVTVTNSNCPASDTFNLAVAQVLELGNTTSLCGNPNGVVLDAGNPGAQFLWNTGATTQTITAVQAGTYWVTITNGTCSQSDTLEVTGSPGEAALYVPNSFTPNGDGLNDRFTGVGDGLTSLHLVIFNRWGELIFETYDPAGWDGTYQGEKAKGDVYVYLIDYTTACTQSQPLQKLGHVVLIR